VPGIREALRRRREHVAAISPIVGGRALKGPAAAMMKSMRARAAAAEVARLYTDFAGVFVLDEVDRKQVTELEALGVRPAVTNTIMSGRRERIALARVVARELGIEA
jgi:LPPG:FO 2-phospho-L-lactate transferase